MRLYWDGLSHEPSHDLRLHYKILNTHAVTSPSAEDPGISLATTRMTSDGYIHRRQKKNRTKRTSQLLYLNNLISW